MHSAYMNNQAISNKTLEYQNSIKYFLHVLTTPNIFKLYYI